MARVIDFGRGVVVVPMELLDGARDIDLDKADVVIVYRDRDEIDVAAVIREALAGRKPDE